MTALRVPVAAIERGRRQLEDAASHYVLHVHRLRVGDPVLLFDTASKLEADAHIVEVRRGTVSCEVEEVRAATLVATTPLWLLAGLTKHDAFEWAIREATALGVTEIVPLTTMHAAKLPTESASKRRERWLRIAIEGARQSGRGDVPRIHPPFGLQEAFGLCNDPQAIRLCFWERATASLRATIASETTPVVVLVGPEGGLDATEVAAAEAAGFRTVSLGRFILRAETATIAALGVVRAFLGG